MNEIFVLIASLFARYTYLFLIILFLALLEVQIEGKHGWTKNLPTWRVKSRIFGFFMGGKDLTGYMLYMLLILFLFFHLPFFGGVQWSIGAELEVISLFLLFSVFWDFLWFVLNPYFGLDKLKKEYVYWHKDWLFGIPLDYPRGVLISLVVSLFAFPGGLIKWGMAFSVFMIGSFIVMGGARLKKNYLAKKNTG